MKFEHNPQLILTKDEFDTLNKASQLCREMDEQTGDPVAACTMCPFNDDCSHMYVDCVYGRAHRALKDIINIAIVK